MDKDKIIEDKIKQEYRNGEIPEVMVEEITKEEQTQVRNDDIPDDILEQQIEELKEKKHEKEINDLLNYACKEGNLDPVDVESWTEKQKEDYYQKCLAYEPQED